MKRTPVALTLALAMSAAAAQAAVTKPYPGQKLAPEARIGLQQAQTIALKAHPGVIADRELEKEAGGSGLRWSFDLRSGGKTFEVGVDAKTGKVLENKTEGRHPD